VRIAFVSRELHPLSGGGIGVAVAGLAAALAETAEVVVLTRSGLEERYRELKAAGALPWPDDVRVAFVDDAQGDGFGSYYNYMHLYSARVLDCLKEVYPEGGPDVIEFPDYLGEGLVTVQERRGRGEFLRNTQVHVRLHTTAEICAVLDGYVDGGFDARQLMAAERHVLREADRILTPGGDVLATYERFYGERELAPASRVRGLIAPPPTPGTEPEAAGHELKLLYVGRIERRKGVAGFVRALTGVPDDGFTLTLVGGDTDTAPLGLSLRDQLELTIAGDDRFRIVDELPREELTQLLAESHVVVCPSRWECWPSVALEALAANRPVLGTPTGGLVEMLGSPDAGWLTEDRSEHALATAVEQLLARPSEVDELIASCGPERVYARLTDPETFRREHADAVRAGRDGSPRRGRGPQRPEPPLVSVVIPYFRLERFIEDTVRSVFAQDHERLEVIIVNDGSLRPEDELLAELAAAQPIRVVTQLNAGLGRARNAGIAQSRGSYVLPVDADNIIRPSFVRRCLEVLEHDPRLAFVTTWSQYIDEAGEEYDGVNTGFQPIGNYPAAVLQDNVAGDATALIRKRIFDLGHWYSPDLTSYEDWQFYRELHAAGHYGRVIPERLLVYRVRDTSMLRDVGLDQHGRLYGEMNAHLREKGVQWEFRSASASTT
jgi:glycogen synthase